MIHIARPSQSGLIIIMRYRNRNYLQMDESSLRIYDEKISKIVRLAAEKISKLSFKDIDGSSRLADLGIDTFASMEMARILRQETGLPVYADSVLDCVYLWHVERNIALLPRASRMTGSYLELNDPMYQKITFKKEIADPGFSLIEVDPTVSLLDYVANSEIYRKTWSDLKLVKPRKIRDISDNEELYEVDFTFISHAGSNAIPKALKVDMVSSEVHLHLISLVESVGVACY
ncbi:hypothetical protein F4805DRAFT_72093 [Annulohypoxylon moriforme]|nr:hypothetical protein F4805DRAFT_72093 [Annulohypoxylon moriforme]